MMTPKVEELVATPDARLREPDEVALLRGPLSKRAVSAEFNEWQAREVVVYIDRLREALAARSVPPTMLGIDPQVLLAAQDLEEEQRNQPEWLWFSNDGPGTVSFGRWGKFPRQAPYIRADLVASPPDADNAQVAPAEDRECTCNIGAATYADFGDGPVRLSNGPATTTCPVHGK